MSDDEVTVFRPGGVSYLRIPADQPAQAASFYESVFGWRLSGDPQRGSFEDGSGHVIGHFVADLRVAGEDGVRPYIYVENVEDTIERLSASGGEIVTPPYPESDLRVATFRDPFGNVMGIWQRVT
jgi:uncharacterized protein